jgi:hypothetical protein
VTRMIRPGTRAGARGPAQAAARRSGCGQQGGRTLLMPVGCPRPLLSAAVLDEHGPGR